MEPDERGLLPGEPDPREPSCAYPGCGLPEFVHGKSGHPFRPTPSVEPGDERWQMVEKDGGYLIAQVDSGRELTTTPIGEREALRLAAAYNVMAHSALRPSVEPDELEDAWREGFRRGIALADLTRPSVEPAGLDVERLARALSFAHPGPWPGKLSSAEFARVVAGAYEHGYEASDLPCTFHRPYDDSMCGKPEVDPIHPGPHERMGRGRHVYRHDPAKRSLALLPTQASDSPEKP